MIAPTVEVTRKGARVPVTPDILRLVNKELTVTPFSPQQAFPQSYSMFQKVPCTSPKHVYVPLHWARARLSHLPFTDTRDPGRPGDLRFEGDLRADLRQPEAVAAVVDAWNRTGGATLCLPTGYGKTTVSLYLACLARRRTMILVHMDLLAKQWEERIRQFVPGATVTRVQGDACDTSGDFVIAMLQTLVSRRYSADRFADVGLVICDEAHHVAAQAFSQTMWSLCAPLTLGLTATPERKDRLGCVVQWFLGDIAFQVKREHQAGTSVKVCRYSCDRYSLPPPVNRQGKLCYTSVISELTADDARTALVAREAVALARGGRDVLVLSRLRRHCAAIAEAVRAAGVDCSTYLGGDKTVPESRVIVATYSLTSEGFDCPRLTGLVLATPATDVVQACGRVMRGSSQASQASSVIVDIVDEWGVCFAQHAKRMKFYKDSGFSLSSPPRKEEPGLAAFAFLPDDA